MSIFELGMLIWFGISWPISVLKSYRMRTTKGKSLPFTLAIFIGYLMGITHKLLYSRDIVLVMYFINLLMVSTDIALYFRNLRLDRQREAQEKAKA